MSEPAAASGDAKPKTPKPVDPEAAKAAAQALKPKPKRNKEKYNNQKKKKKELSELAVKGLEERAWMPNPPANASANGNPPAAAEGGDAAPAASGDGAAPAAAPARPLLLSAKLRRKEFNALRRQIQKQKRESGDAADPHLLAKFQDINKRAALTREERTKLAKAEDARKREEKMKRRAEKHKEIAERMVAVRERSTAKREARKKLQSEKRERGNAKDRESVLLRRINARISEHGNKKELDAALQAYKELKETKLEFIGPNVYTLTNLVNACVRCGELAMAEDFIKELAEKVKPNEVTYTALIKGYTQEDSQTAFDRALALLNVSEMEANEQPPNLRTFNTLLRGCFRGGHADAALKLLERMRAAKVDPDVFSYDYAIRALCVRGRVKEAWKLAAEMTKQWKHASVYGVLAIASALSGDGENVQRAVEGSKQGDVTLDVYNETNEQKESAALFQKNREAELNSEVARAVAFSAASPKGARTAFDKSDRVRFLHAENETNEVVNFAKIFGNDNPVKLEVCSGNGEWIIEHAEKDKNVNWVAVEMRVERQWSAFARMQFKKLKNVLLLVGEANHILRHCVTPGSVAEVFVNYPDPPVWSGSKQKLLCASFFKKVHKVLAADAPLVIVTDDEPYARTAVTELTEVDNYFKSALGSKGFSNNVPDTYGSSYFDRFWQTGDRNQRWYIRWLRTEHRKRDRAEKADENAAVEEVAPVATEEKKEKKHKKDKAVKNADEVIAPAAAEGAASSDKKEKKEKKHKKHAAADDEEAAGETKEKKHKKAKAGDEAVATRT